MSYKLPSTITFLCGLLLIHSQNLLRLQICQSCEKTIHILECSPILLLVSVPASASIERCCWSFILTLKRMLCTWSKWGFVAALVSSIHRTTFLYGDSIRSRSFSSKTYVYLHLNKKYSQNYEKSIIVLFIILFQPEISRHRGNKLVKSTITESYSVTSSCTSSHTRLRSAIDGCEPPRRNRPFPFSQIFSRIDKEDDKTFSASEAAFGFSGRPSAGPNTVFIT